MLLRNIIMAIFLAFLYLKFFKIVADAINVTKAIHGDKPAIAGAVSTHCIARVIFYGIILNVLLTLFGLTKFNFSDIILCITFIVFYICFLDKGITLKGTVSHAEKR